VSRECPEKHAEKNPWFLSELLLLVLRRYIFTGSASVYAGGNYNTYTEFLV
jgi:hypothetical protein